MEKSAALFKGATRPACIWGVPMKPFMVCVGTFILAAFWISMPLIFGIIPCLYIMHQIAKEDDQRFRQLYLYLFVNFFGTGNKRHWQDVQFFSPVSYKPQPIKK